jgi:hypothetical protein
MHLRPSNKKKESYRRGSKRLRSSSSIFLRTSAVDNKPQASLSFFLRKKKETKVNFRCRRRDCARSSSVGNTKELPLQLGAAVRDPRTPPIARSAPGCELGEPTGTRVNAFTALRDPAAGAREAGPTARFFSFLFFFFPSLVYLICILSSIFFTAAGQDECIPFRYTPHGYIEMYLELTSSSPNPYPALMPATARL